MSTISEFGLELWFIFPAIMLVLIGAMLFFVIHFWRLARARDKTNEAQKKMLSKK